MLKPGCLTSGCPVLFIRFILVFFKHTVLRAFGIIILSALDGPEKEEPGPDTQHQGKEYKKSEGPHQVSAPFRIRRELVTTKSELAAMAPAAMIG